MHDVLALSLSAGCRIVVLQFFFLYAVNRSCWSYQVGISCSASIWELLPKQGALLPLPKFVQALMTHAIAGTEHCV